MNRRFKKRIRLKKNVALILKLILVFFIIIYMKNNKFLKHQINKNINNYISKKYEPRFELLSMKTEKKIKKDDEIFALKEEKDIPPLVYIYNTHQTERYLSDNVLYEPNVMIASKYLGEKLNNNGLKTIIETRSINDVLKQNGWSYGASYKVSRRYLEDTYQNNNSLIYFFDIHRDAGSYKYTSICTDDKCYARILFLIGLENPNYMENQIYAEELSKRVNNKVSGLSKGILQKQGKKVNGIYNEDFSKRLILIEVGGENNKIDEVYNTLDILSEVIIDYIKEETRNGN